MRQPKRDFRAPWWRILWCRVRQILIEALGGLCFAAVMVLLPMIAAVMAG